MGAKTEIPGNGRLDDEFSGFTAPFLALFGPSCNRISESGRMGVTQFSPEQATDVHIETFSRSALSPTLCWYLRMWARRRETRLGIEVVFRMKSSAPASREAVS